MRRRTFTAVGICTAGALFAQKKGARPKPTRVYRDSEIFPAVKAIVVELLKVDEKKVVPAARLVQDLGCDSLNVVELVMECEDRFGIEISDAEGEKIKTVQDLVAQVKTSLKKQQRLS
jgi:acyl carrier protein